MRNRRSSFGYRQPSIKDKLIDQQILRLHKAMLDKLCQKPELLPQVLEKLEERYASGKIRHGAYLTWSCSFELLESDPNTMYQVLLEESPRMNKLRRITPLVGILDEDEREAALF